MLINLIYLSMVKKLFLMDCCTGSSFVCTITIELTRDYYLIIFLFHPHTHILNKLLTQPSDNPGQGYLVDSSNEKYKVQCAVCIPVIGMCIS